MSKKLLVLASALALTALAGCRPFAPATPPGFVDLSESYSNGEYRSTTADGMVLGVRAFPNKPAGELSFWTKVVENRLRDTSGYALLETKDVKDRNGNAGKQLRFGHDESTIPHLYYLTIFVNEDHVYLLEAGGTKDLVTKHEPQIAWSIENFLPK
jgi:hypothetical protein